VPMTETERRVVGAWKEAAADLGIQFTSPFAVTLSDGRRCEHLGLVHHFGRRIGTLIAVLNEPSERIQRPAGDDYYWTILGPSYASYHRQSFIDTLDDWQFFGRENERPGWYSGKSWT